VGYEEEEGGPWLGYEGARVRVGVGVGGGEGMEGTAGGPAGTVV